MLVVTLEEGPRIFKFSRMEAVFPSCCVPAVPNSSYWPEDPSHGGNHQLLVFISSFTSPLPSAAILNVEWENEEKPGGTKKEDRNRLERSNHTEISGPASHYR